MILQLQSECRWGSYGCEPEALCEWLLSLEGDVDVWVFTPKPGVAFCGILKREGGVTRWL